MKKKFRFISLILTLVMCVTLCVPAFAVAPDMHEDAVIVYSESQLQAEIARGTKEIIIPQHNNVEIIEHPNTDGFFPNESRSNRDTCANQTINIVKILCRNAKYFHILRQYL